MYRHLAHLYDWPGAVDFSAHLLARTKTLFAEKEIRKPGPILDLACGTGTLTTALAQAGWDLIGLDCSPAMLGQARQKAAAQGLSDATITWVEADMRDFCLKSPVAAVLCYYDSINHLLSVEEVAACFEATYRALVPGGWFFFDVNTAETFIHLWQGQDIYEGPNHRLVIETTYDSTRGRARADITAQEYRDGRLVVIEDPVEEQYYEASELEARLARAGFQAIAREPFSPIDLLPPDQPLKILWCSQKPF